MLFFLGLTLVLIGLTMYGLRQVHLRNIETNSSPGSDKPMPEKHPEKHLPHGPYADAWGPKREILRRILNGPHLKVFYESSFLFCVMMLPSRMHSFSPQELVTLVVPEVLDVDETLETRIERAPGAYLTNAKYGLHLDGTLSNDNLAGRWHWHGLVLFFDWDDTTNLNDLGELETFIADSVDWRSLWGLPALDETPLQASLRYAVRASET